MYIMTRELESQLCVHFHSLPYISIVISSTKQWHFYGKQSCQIVLTVLFYYALQN